MAQNMIAAEKLFLTADRSEVVAEGDDRAAFLYCVPGDEIPADAAELLGLVDGALPKGKAAKEKAAGATKPKAAAETKGA